MSARLLLAVVAAIGATTLAAAGLGLVNAVAHPVVWALTGVGLGAGLFRLPALLRAALARVDGTGAPGVRALAAGGTAAVAALLAIGAHALASAGVSERWLADVGRLWFPAAPLLGILAGLGRFAYVEALRWAAAEEDDAP